MKRLIVFTALTAIALSVRAAQPSLQFGPGGLDVLNLKPGTKVAWMSLTRTRVDAHSLLRIDRGIEVAKATKKAGVARPNADKSRSIWVVAAIDEDVAGVVASPGYAASTVPIVVNTSAGSPTFTIVSPEIELMYVRSKGGAWFLSATDGGAGDADGVQNTEITVSLQSLERVQGNPHPPASASAGDMILMLDPRDNRTAVIRVAE